MMQSIVLALKQVFGALCVILGTLAGLFALVVYFMDVERRDVAPVIVLASVATLILVLGVRVLRVKRSTPHAGRTEPKVVATPYVAESPAQRFGRRKYDEFAFGDPPPSSKQFGYAMHLGIPIEDGMTKWMMSDAIDEAIERQRDHEPAAKEQLQQIQELHGILPRTVTRGEARRVIEFLDNHSLPCPFCGIDVCAYDRSCCACNRSLKRMRIPIFID
jgi:hypothetical protein